jgi:chromatin structure-remodeling complex protein RSC7
VDDYYEEKTLEEITPLGLKAGDPVGDLPDPNATSHGNELSLATNANANVSNKADRTGGGGGGVYRAGGPTTIFGGGGWGPFSDGPLNAVRKSILSRDGVAEENWMYMMASRVVDAGGEWAKWRKEGLKVGGGGEGLIPTVMEDFPDVVPRKAKERGLEHTNYEEEEEEEEEEEGAEVVEPTAKRRRVGFEGDQLPLGVYEAHTGVVHCQSRFIVLIAFTSPDTSRLDRADTQPTRSRWEALPDPEKRVLGGSKAGNGAWALAWIDTVVELPISGEQDSPGVKAREKLLKEVAENPVVDLTLDS